jgi:hypothetical protein
LKRTGISEFINCIYRQTFWDELWWLGGLHRQSGLNMLDYSKQQVKRRHYHLPSEKCKSFNLVFSSSLTNTRIDLWKVAPILPILPIVQSSTSPTTSKRINDYISSWPTSPPYSVRTSSHPSSTHSLRTFPSKISSHLLALAAHFNLYTRR